MCASSAAGYRRRPSLRPRFSLAGFFLCHPERSEGRTQSDSRVRNLTKRSQIIEVFADDFRGDGAPSPLRENTLPLSPGERGDAGNGDAAIDSQEQTHFIADFVGFSSQTRVLARGGFFVGVVRERPATMVRAQRSSASALSLRAVHEPPLQDWHDSGSPAVSNSTKRSQIAHNSKAFSF
jgi:hypothetical protein